MTTVSNDTMPDSTWTVNEVLRRYPDAVGVFNEMGVDACCGGASSLADAAGDAGVALDELLARVGEVATASGAAR
ncbi:MAG TPA: DUF542 domain-containing protein [Gemmatimonadales bacterium]